MNETTFEKAPGFERLKQDLERMVRGIVACVPSLAIPRAAAE
jgi:hypothetical protein